MIDFFYSESVRQQSYYPTSPRSQDKRTCVRISLCSNRQSYANTMNAALVVGKIVSSYCDDVDNVAIGGVGVLFFVTQIKKVSGLINSLQSHPNYKTSQPPLELWPSWSLYSSIALEALPPSSEASRALSKWSYRLIFHSTDCSMGHFFNAAIQKLKKKTKNQKLSILCSRCPP